MNPRTLDLSVVGIDRFTIRVPFRAIVARNMVRELPHWDIFEICRVTLHNGVVGTGETMSYYTWGATDDAAVKRAWGKNAAELMWDDSLGSGLQMALFDAVATSAGVPIHALLGHQVRDKAPISWWDFDMPPDDLAAECALASRQGYKAFKTKARPWWDLRAQLDAVTKAVPDHFRLGIDFNGTLLDADHAADILPELEKKYPVLANFESPIPQGDVEGGKRIQEMTDVPIAHHYGSPPAMVQIQEKLCEGFVVGGGASRVMAQGAVAAEAQLPFWLQLVGTGLTAAFSLHFAAVLEAARWPAVNCHQLFVYDLLRPTFPVKDGFAEIPQAPGLGFELDSEAIEAMRIERPGGRPEGPDRLMRVIYPGGETWYYAHGDQYFQHSLSGDLPVFVRGVRLEMVPDDGTPQWQEMHRRALKEPFRE